VSARAAGCSITARHRNQEAGCLPLGHTKQPPTTHLTLKLALRSDKVRQYGELDTVHSNRFFFSVVLSIHTAANMQIVVHKCTAD
jgi:hypothetical protein